MDGCLVEDLGCSMERISFGDTLLCGNCSIDFREALSAMWLQIHIEYKQTPEDISGPLDCYQCLMQGWEQTVALPRGAGLGAAAPTAASAKPSFAPGWDCLGCGICAGSASSWEQSELPHSPWEDMLLGGGNTGSWGACNSGGVQAVSWQHLPKSLTLTALPSDIKRKGWWVIKPTGTKSHC